MRQVRTSTILMVFVLAKAISIVIAITVFGVDGGTENLSLLAHASSCILFAGLISFATKQSLCDLMAATAPQNPHGGRLLTWVALAIPLGFLIRFGTEGLYLTVVNAYDNQLAVDEFIDLRNGVSGSGYSILLAIAAVAVIGAIDEEFIYRKVLLWHFSKAWGGVFYGVIVTSLIFGLIHWNPVALLAAMCMACIYVAVRRLWVIIIIHAAGNVFHPLVRPIVSVTTWNAYFTASLVAAILLCLVMIHFIVKARRMPTMWRDIKCEAQRV